MSAQPTAPSTRPVPCPAYNCGVDLAATDRLKHWETNGEDPLTNCEHALLIEISAIPEREPCSFCNQLFPTTKLKLLEDHKKYTHEIHSELRITALRDGELGTIYGYARMVRIYADDETKQWAQEKQQKTIFERLVLKIQKSAAWPQLMRFRGYTDQDNFKEDLEAFLSKNRKPGTARHFPVPIGEFLNHEDAQYNPDDEHHKKLRWDIYWRFFQHEYDEGHI